MILVEKPIRGKVYKTQKYLFNYFAPIPVPILNRTRNLFPAPAPDCLPSLSATLFLNRTS